jgi:hypothetical protein
MRNIRGPSPALAVALIALFVSLSGTAVAASPIVKRALFADNAAKLKGKTPGQLIQRAAELPGPASTVAGLVTIKAGTWSANPDEEGDFTVACDPGQKAIGGGWEDPTGFAHAWDSRPTPDGLGWKTYVTVSAQAPSAQSGALYAVCLR